MVNTAREPGHIVTRYSQVPHSGVRPPSLRCAATSPDLFARACGLEELLNHRRRELGKDPVWLTRFNAPLAGAVTAAQEPLPGLDVTDDISCDDGACFS